MSVRVNDRFTGVKFALPTVAYNEQMGMKKYYNSLSAIMREEIEGISEEIEHSGEKGRNNEEILKSFLGIHLPKKYGLTTGKVVGANGDMSKQIDIIIYDRLNTPSLKESRVFSIVPIESVYGVIAVKTTLNRSELTDSIENIASVRRLSITAAMTYEAGHPIQLDEESVLRPRALIFGYKSSWANIENARKAFVEILEETNDKHRPHCMCVLDQGLVVRQAYKTDTNVYSNHVLMHFFLFLLRLVDSFTVWRVDLSKYIEDYERTP